MRVRRGGEGEGGEGEERRRREGEEERRDEMRRGEGKGEGGEGDECEKRRMRREGEGGEEKEKEVKEGLNVHCSGSTPIDVHMVWNCALKEGFLLICVLNFVANSVSFVLNTSNCSLAYKSTHFRHLIN